MYMHPYAKEDPNWFIDSTVIGPDVHTHSPLPKLFSFFLPFTLHLDIYLYIYLDSS